MPDDAGHAIAAAALLLRRRWSAPVAAVALAQGWRNVGHALPESADTGVVAARLAVRGLGWAIRQEAGLLLRHWWPLMATCAFGSRQVRRMLVSALVVDTVVMLVEQRGARERVGIAPALAGRRLDDLAYGAGLWWGAANAGSARVLLPRRPGLR